MCGISAVLNKNIHYAIYNDLYNSLLNLQHRGQESCGFITFSYLTNMNYILKKFGLVNNYLNDITNLNGNMGIAHVRYPTSGNTTYKEIQPFIIKSNYIISLVHNGNLTNKDELLIFLNKKNIFTESTSDSEVILHLFNYYLNTYCLEFDKKITNLLITNIIKKINSICKGSYSVIVMINNFGIIAFRDIYGIRPLVYSITDNNVIISSETVGLPNSSYYNVNNGEILIINKNFELTKINLINDNNQVTKQSSTLVPCLFEYIYFARLESYINDI